MIRKKGCRLGVVIGCCLLVMAFVSSCSSTKFVPENEYLLEKVEVKSDVKGFDASALLPYVRQRANSRWFSLFKVPLGTYSLAGRDSLKWINRTLKNLGEEPVIFDSAQARISCEILTSALKNMGYMNSRVSLSTHVRGKKLKAVYMLHPGEPYFIHSVSYDIQDDSIAALLSSEKDFSYELKAGVPFTVNRLDQERQRITSYLSDRGYYHFHKDFIHFDADTVRGSRLIDLTLRLLKYKANDDEEETLHPRYHVRNVTFQSSDGETLKIRKGVLENSTAIESGKPFSTSALQKTYNNFSRLNAIRYTNVRFTELPDTTLLDCQIQLSTGKRRSIIFQPEGTNTAGDLGAAVSLTYEDRNLFKGSEMWSVQLRGAFEAITGLEGYKNEDYEEYGLETKLTFPRFVAPFLSRSFRRNINATSEVSLSYNLQNRPEFHRRVFSAGWRYRWGEPHHHTTYKLDLLDMNYIYMPWISETFKHEYLDSVSSRNAILRYNYEDLFIMKIGFGLSYNNGVRALKANFETAGNLLNLSSNLFSFKKNTDGQYTLFNIAYAQYVKVDFDYTRVFQFDTHNSLVLHGGIGVAYPYGNSKILPFEKRYFSGGANSVRGWGVRRLGPGTYHGTNGGIDFINQTGDIKLDLNVEYRTFLFWKINGALFIDAGNIWTIRKYDEQPGGEFRFDKFYKQIAVSYGLGLRLNFDYFILRFDAGMKAINPAYENSREHYPLLHPKWSRDFTFHFAVGLPF